MDLTLEGGADGDVDDDGPSRIVLSPRHGCSVLRVRYQDVFSHKNDPSS